MGAVDQKSGLFNTRAPKALPFAFEGFTNQILWRLELAKRKTNRSFVLRLEIYLSYNSLHIFNKHSLASSSSELLSSL